MKRYFIVSYIGTHNELNTRTTGQINFWSKGSYLNRKDATEIIEKSSNIKDVVITFITELSYKDYKEWTRSDTNIE